MNGLYNEVDPYAARWLRRLVVAGQIAPGAVDERSVAELSAADLRDVSQFHTFAGIGVWSHAARRAGWPDDFPLWTGSCPCQPFSAAGAGLGVEDERHLWPEWFRLIGECRPPVIAGEQVASADGLAYADSSDAWRNPRAATRSEGEDGCEGNERRAVGVKPVDSGAAHRRLGNADDARPQGLSGPSDRVGEPRRDDALKNGLAAASGFWGDVGWLDCRDGKRRPTQSGLFPLAHGVTARVGRLRAYGNAIVGPLATAFLGCLRDSLMEAA